MKYDAIVEEIHQVRQKMLAECHGDLDQLLDRLQAAEPLDGDRVVSLEAVRERRQREQSRHQQRTEADRGGQRAARQAAATAQVGGRSAPAA